MWKNLLLLLLKQFLIGLIRSIVIAVIMLIVTMTAIFRGMWEQSHIVAIGWLGQIRIIKVDERIGVLLYWPIRIISLFLMSVALMVLAQILTWLIERTLRL